jgi:hypothetical protein
MSLFPSSRKQESLARNEATLPIRIHVFLGLVHYERGCRFFIYSTESLLPFYLTLLTYQATSAQYLVRHVRCFQRVGNRC